MGEIDISGRERREERRREKREGERREKEREIFTAAAAAALCVLCP